MAKILMVIAPSDFRDSEYFEPKKVFEENGFEVMTASKVVGRITGADQGVAESTIKAVEVNVADFDAVVFVGGPGMVALVDDAEFKKLADGFYKAGKLTTAICVAPAILANAGILKNKKATSWSGVSNILKSAGAIFTESSVEVDGNIITADGPNSAQEFSEKIVRVLKNKS